MPFKKEGEDFILAYRSRDVAYHGREGMVIGVRKQLVTGHPQSQNMVISDSSWLTFFLFVFNKAVLMITVKLKKSHNKATQNTPGTFNWCT